MPHFKTCLSMSQLIRRRKLRNAQRVAIAVAIANQRPNWHQSPPTHWTWPDVDVGRECVHRLTLHSRAHHKGLLEGLRESAQRFNFKSDDRPAPASCSVRRR